MAKAANKVIAARKKLIARLKKRKPVFRRPLAYAYAMKPGWRKPRGIHSKMREGEKSKPAVVKTGYGSARAIRGLHPSGYAEAYITSISQLQKIDAQKQAARLASGLSERKRKVFAEKAKSLGIKVLNP
jgi:large subunit ribosomal protein L32e